MSGHSPAEFIKSNMWMPRGASFGLHNTLVKYTLFFHDNNVVHVYR